MPKYVHKGILQFILSSLEVHAAEIAREQAWLQKLLQESNNHLPAEAKQRLLDDILLKGGPDLLLRLGTLKDTVVPAPIFYVFLNSGSPGELIEKLERYDHYLHSSNHIQLIESAEGWLVARHVSRRHASISPAEDLFICGVVVSLLKLIGCRDVDCRWQQIGAPQLREYLAPDIGQAVKLGQFSAWRFGWSAFEARRNIPGLDEFIVQLESPVRIAQRQTMSSTVEGLLCQDLGRRWTLNDLAGRLHSTPRTIQRALRKENNSFMKILRETRLSVATKLLFESDVSLSEIGFMVGFSDYAHFCREFKKERGVTPFAFRRNN